MLCHAARFDSCSCGQLTTKSITASTINPMADAVPISSSSINNRSVTTQAQGPLHPATLGDRRHGSCRQRPRVSRKHEVVAAYVVTVPPRVPRCLSKLARASSCRHPNSLFVKSLGTAPGELRTSLKYRQGHSEAPTCSGSHLRTLAMMLFRIMAMSCVEWSPFWRSGVLRKSLTIRYPCDFGLQRR